MPEKLFEELAQLEQVEAVVLEVPELENSMIKIQTMMSMSI